jgi:23S rRNA (guanosine2251-2'-O)-methyltransferase
LNYLIGKNSSKEVILHRSDRIKTIYLTKENLDLLKEVKDNIPYKIVQKQYLSQLVNTDSHQGIAILLKERDYLDLKDFFKKIEHQKKSIVLMLDNIFDPQNVGTLIRSAECFAVDAVIFSKNRGCSVTPTVTKAASGASELVDLIRVSNLADSIKKFKENDFEVIVTKIDKEAQSIYDFDFPDKTLLVMGSEGIGVQHLIQKLSDHKIYIPMKGKIDSLNVAQATAIVLSFFQN